MTTINTIRGDTQIRVDKFFTEDWPNYEDTSTIVGWSAFTVKNIHCIKIGKLVFVNFDLEGTGDANAPYFTVPCTSTAEPDTNVTCFRAEDDVTWTPGLAYLPNGSNVVWLYSSMAGGGWTNAVTRRAIGQLWFVATE